MRLARRTERRVAWSLITAALVLMVFRRALPLYRVLASDPSVALDPYQESIGLALSFLMVVGIAAIAPLFTAVRRAEETLKVSERRASLVLEATSDGIYDVDLRTGATRYSPRYAEMLGYGPTELVLSPESGTFESLLHPDDRESTLRTLGRCLAGKTDGYNAYEGGGLALDREPRPSRGTRSRGKSPRAGRHSH
jgi:PAS domain-containing protein